MFSEAPTIIPSHQDNQAMMQNNFPKPPKISKKVIFWGAIGFGVVVLLVLGVVLLSSRSSVEPVDDSEPSANQSGELSSSLPGATFPVSGSENIATTTFTDLAIEYLSFADFYIAPDNEIKSNIIDYELPLNVKIDVVNYYDVSRKLSLDAGLNNLNEYGFTTIPNPWAKEARDFYAIYSELEEKQVPVLVTSDFILYYYQSILKKAFKDIEENVFYDNLWDINKQMYSVAKARYESRLAKIGDINDSILEGARLETVFFAVALELLKPQPDQIIEAGALDNNSKFIAAEAERFSFLVPTYLKDDVEAELKLIRSDKKLITKSPVLLYERDYSDFKVPYDYRSNAKLYNFYLTTRWLNSVWPLNYRSQDCPECLLDKEDWRINLIAASFISRDFSDLPGVKNKWARIYKIISYFKGLREDLNYVFYRDTMADIFGSDYNIEELFSDQNGEALANLEKLRSKLLSYDFPAVRGALVKDDPDAQAKIGFKMLVESYWPNDYIFSRLISPAVGNYLGEKVPEDSLVSCSKTAARCNGIALDVINLLWPISDNEYFEKNTNYANYTSAINKLQQEIQSDNVWHTADYWTNLQAIKAYLSMDRKNLPLFYKSSAWRNQSLDTAVGAWINLQLPMEKFTINQLGGSNNFNGFSNWSENSYVDPNLDLINELIANNIMILKMLNALQLNIEIPSATQEIQSASNNFNILKKIIIKELTNEKLTAADNEAILDFTKQLTVEPAPDNDKRITIKPPTQKNSLREDLSRLKLMVLVHQTADDSRAFSVGPIWDYQESR